ncbi:MAG: tRNA preQ1(34) S-adenosylmethionine ribosyltransferase-isomerase QueA [Gammaproteobacteria bacterium]|nr:tRNA preQ1(34) S-adenosylmethionine ribosyltransferase-isomerase QueA [Gammaproteobacteria bacterium]NNJ49738.1 tRNA preQ1(34) S-adenosylmethionine ribosyltransferase-isomerase QueA [Gammaproteobacteria bacterium]
MKTRDFHYQLPQELIAQTPSDVRSNSRLLHYSRDSKNINHLRFSDIIDLVKPEDLLVFNNTRVIPARMFGSKETGGKVEILVERLTSESRCLAHIRASKTPKAGTVITLRDNDEAETEQPAKLSVTVEGRDGELFILSSNTHSMAEIMEQAGHMPLPPYISRADSSEDFSRYQTVYAATPGAVAAPTAGLHFDEPLLEKLEDKGVDSAFVTLHVGAGTFQPVRSEYIEDHDMHFEYLVVPQETVDKCQQTRENGGRIIAVGTTTVRSLETASQHGKLQAYAGETDIFIYPGYQFKSIDALITNFHLPESTLLMLISAFAGKDEMLRCYAEAVKKEYRFFSYGDAMFIS